MHPTTLFGSSGAESAKTLDYVCVGESIGVKEGGEEGDERSRVASLTGLPVQKGD